MAQDGLTEVSIVMPCLNEVETLAHCIRAAREGARIAGIRSYEIIVADNGSTDGSQRDAVSEGAILVDVPIRGYGAALRAGIRAASGRYVLVADSDFSYDFTQIDGFIGELRAGYDLVMGSRLRGTVKHGAMPTLHRYLGNPLLTALGNLFFGTKLTDYHCGMRAFDRSAILGLDLKTDGMEFASEMVLRAALSGLSICEIPITYRPDGRSRPPHLRTWRDGWRHLRFMLLFSPRWLFLYPGIASTLAGLALFLLVIPRPLRIGPVILDVHTLLVSSSFLVVGIMLIEMATFVRSYASKVGLLPSNRQLEWLVDNFSLGLGLASGAFVAAMGFALYVVGVALWGQHAFGPLVDYEETLRVVISGTTLLILGIQGFFWSFALSLLSLD